MPLSPPADREPQHLRTVDCRGYRRADGLWDIEGHVKDVKEYDFNSQYYGTVHRGEPVHDMWIRLIVDDDLLVHEAEAAADGHPFPTCPAITPAFAKLAGLRIKPGWMRDVNRVLGGTQGCTHLVELLGPMATTAFQTVFPSRERSRATKEKRDRPSHLDTCHALASDGPVVEKLWPEFYTGG